MGGLFGSIRGNVGRSFSVSVGKALVRVFMRMVVLVGGMIRALVEALMGEFVSTMGKMVVKGQGRV